MSIQVIALAAACLLAVAALPFLRRRMKNYQVASEAKIKRAEEHRIERLRLDLKDRLDKFPAIHQRNIEIAGDLFRDQSVRGTYEQAARYFADARSNFLGHRLGEAIRLLDSATLTEIRANSKACSLRSDRDSEALLNGCLAKRVRPRFPRPLYQSGVL